MEAKQHMNEWRLSQSISQEENRKNFFRIEWQWEHYKQKYVGNNKGSIRKKVHSSKYVHKKNS